MSKCFQIVKREKKKNMMGRSFFLIAQCLIGHKSLRSLFVQGIPVTRVSMGQLGPRFDKFMSPLHVGAVSWIVQNFICPWLSAMIRGNAHCAHCSRFVNYGSEIKDAWYWIQSDLSVKPRICFQPRNRLPLALYQLPYLASTVLNTLPPLQEERSWELLPHDWQHIRSEVNFLPLPIIVFRIWRVNIASLHWIFVQVKDVE